MLEMYLKKLFFIGDADAHSIEKHLTEQYPNEACGVMISDICGQDSVKRVHFFDNIQDRLHEWNRERYPRTAKDAYNIEAKEWLNLTADAEKSNERLLCLFHSHIDCDAYFSKEDELQAAPWGEPNYPELLHLVISVHARKITAFQVFKWDKEKNMFVSIHSFGV